MLEINEIMELIPHRYPFLLVDRITELEPGKRAVGIKNLSVNEPFFQGHFPNRPIMPGVLIVEALAQTACVAGLSLEKNKGKIGVFTGIDSMRFKKKVVPGDVLILKVEFLAFKLNMGKVSVEATVSGEIAANGQIKFAIIDK